MKRERRHTTRIEVKIKVDYEIVNWNEIRLDKLNHPKQTNSIDISERGLCLHINHDLSHHTLHLLENGKKKFRLGLYLYESYPPLLVFARLIWRDKLPVMNDMMDECYRYGMVFIDELNSVYRNIKKFIEEEQKRFLDIKTML